jgi:excinuclease ABC subunit C
MPTEELRRAVSALPKRPGVYLFRDTAGEILYVGKAKSLRDRVRSYFRRDAAGSPRTARLVRGVAGLETIVTGSEAEALLLESNLVKEHRPRFNIQLRDDKSYPYVKVTVGEPFPRVIVTRRLAPDGSRYFGPFTDVGAMRRALRLIMRRFRVRTCHYALPEQAPDRPCLDYHIDRCRAPCVGLQDERDYRAMIEEILGVLSGGTGPLRRAVRAEMEDAASGLAFERAAELRDVLAGLEVIDRRQTSVDFRGGDRDVLGIADADGTACCLLLRVRDGLLLGREIRFLDNIDGEDPSAIVDAALKGFLLRGDDVPPEILVPAQFEDRLLLEEVLGARRPGRVRILRPQRGQKRRLLELAATNARHLLEEHASVAEPAGEIGRSDEIEVDAAARGLAEALDLSAPPRDLVCFDISTLGGRESVGSAVWLHEGRPHRSEYRRLRIRATPEGRPDDYAMMQEVVGRYFQRRVREGSPLPDLVLVDGGRGQLGAALQGMEGAGVSDLPVAALAKRLEEIHLPGRSGTVVLERGDPALHWLQRARDEAHRFALGYNRTLRRKRTLRSVLRDVPGVGPARETELLRRFGSPAGVAQRSVSELASVPGIGRATARRILETLRADVYDDGEEGRNA